MKRISLFLPDSMTEWLERRGRKSTVIRAILEKSIQEVEHARQVLEEAGFSPTLVVESPAVLRQALQHEDDGVVRAAEVLLAYYGRGIRP